MAKYKIEWSERKSIAGGKQMLKATLKDETGAEFQDVAIWDSFPGFAGIMTGHDIEGDLVVKQNGQYENKSLYPIKVASTGTTGPNRGGAIAKAQETKAQYIATAQNNKESGIKIASTASMANATALAFLQGESIKDVGVFKAEYKKWREFYWTEWDKEDKDFPAF